MDAMRRLITPVALLTLSLTAGFLAWAQPFPQGQYPPPQGQQGPPPQGQGQDDPADAAEHGVGRLSLINGSVSLTRGDSGESIPASINEPLVTTDRVITGQGSRAEIQFDPGSMIRLASNTEVRMGDLQYHHYLVQISQGTTLFRVLQDTDARIEISTPSVSVAPLRAGIYRVTVRPDGSSEITVRAGEAELNSPSGSERLPAGQTMYSRGPVDNPEFRSAAAIPYDEWDRWNADRDRFFERAPDVSRYAGPDIEGAQELSNYGRWVWDPQYGNVWTPSNEPPDWAPYRDGRWDDVDYYGWSWVGNEPWGWAPYHYGNWYRASFGWAWYPGAIGPRHYWRPAMVGFFGFGEPGFGVSLGFGYGNVGWVPLAPFERYRPWYGARLYRWPKRSHRQQHQHYECLPECPFQRSGHRPAGSGLRTRRRGPQCFRAPQFGGPRSRRCGERRNAIRPRAKLLRTKLWRCRCEHGLTIPDRVIVRVMSFGLTARRITAAGDISNRNRVRPPWEATGPTSARSRPSVQRRSRCVSALRS